jgi:hypothetical protein
MKGTKSDKYIAFVLEAFPDNQPLILWHHNGNYNTWSAMLENV